MITHHPLSALRHSFACATASHGVGTPCLKNNTALHPSHACSFTTSTLPFPHFIHAGLFFFGILEDVTCSPSSASSAALRSSQSVSSLRGAVPCGALVPALASAAALLLAFASNPCASPTGFINKCLFWGRSGEGLSAVLTTLPCWLLHTHPSSSRARHVMTPTPLAFHPRFHMQGKRCGCPLQAHGTGS